jgi:hypothetical protein
MKASHKDLTTDYTDGTDKKMVGLSFIRVIRVIRG